VIYSLHFHNLQLWKNSYVHVLIIAEACKQEDSSEACLEVRVGSVCFNEV